ncbi:outer membrane protein 31 fragment 3 [Helicobacter acinonychis str. Sheeba]|uniref:Outer membrane protein 31 3 n=1 Tax=Helicobacter acinonychis (strain Sheeba) TaxID=382638 RepID=Q17VC2_HELAH|nr:outer membrane protein 31 fragment 3 [Helicobacter acinonychis str. Sheeba]
MDAADFPFLSNSGLRVNPAKNKEKAIMQHNMALNWA